MLVKSLFDGQSGVSTTTAKHPSVLYSTSEAEHITHITTNYDRNYEAPNTNLMRGSVVKKVISVLLSWKQVIGR